MTFRPGFAAFQARAVPKFRSMNTSSQLWMILAVADFVLSSMSAILPTRRAFFDECGKAFGGVLRRHQFGQINRLNRSKFRGDPFDRAMPGGARGEAQRVGAFRRQIAIEVAERGAFGIVGNFRHEADPGSLLGADRAPGKQKILRRRQCDTFGQQTGSRRSEYADLNLRLAEFGIRPDKQQMTGGRKFKTAAEALAADCRQDRNRRRKTLQDQSMKAREHRRASIRQMFLD